MQCSSTATGAHIAAAAASNSSRLVLAMQQAVEGLASCPDAVLIGGNRCACYLQDNSSRLREPMQHHSRQWRRCTAAQMQCLHADVGAMRWHMGQHQFQPISDFGYFCSSVCDYVIQQSFVRALCSLLCCLRCVLTGGPKGWSICPCRRW
jgi:hypothetical protein